MLDKFFKDHFDLLPWQAEMIDLILSGQVMVPGLGTKTMINASQMIASMLKDKSRIVCITSKVDKDGY